MDFGTGGKSAGTAQALEEGLREIAEAIRQGLGEIADAVRAMSAAGEDHVDEGEGNDEGPYY